MACGGLLSLMILGGAKERHSELFAFTAKGGNITELAKKLQTSVHCKPCVRVLKYARNTMFFCFHLENSHTVSSSTVTTSSNSKAGWCFDETSNYHDNLFNCDRDCSSNAQP